MQREACTRFVAVEQTGIGYVFREFGRPRGRLRQFEKYRRHRWPKVATQRVARVVAISPAIAHPAQLAAIGYGHRHAKAAGSHPMTEGCRRFDALDTRQDSR